MAKKNDNDLDDMPLKKGKTRYASGGMATVKGAGAAKRGKKFKAPTIKPKRTKK